MNLLTEHSVVKCGHEGVVRLQASRRFVTVGGVPLLVAEDPVGRPIVACPNYGINVKPCTSTGAVGRGLSRFVTVDRRPVCLDTLEGVTDGVDVQVVHYTVRNPAQRLVAAGS